MDTWGLGQTRCKAQKGLHKEDSGLQGFTFNSRVLGLEEMTEHCLRRSRKAEETAFRGSSTPQSCEAPVPTSRYGRHEVPDAHAVCWGLVKTKAFVNYVVRIGVSVTEGRVRLKRLKGT